MPFMTRIPDDLARFGLAVETVPGWQTRGSSSFNPGGVVDHWTAGPKNAPDKARPSLNVVVNGRAGLPGPLANVYLARDGVCVVVAAGRANHAGVGGYRGLVGNSAVYGIEAECGGDGDWSKSQQKAYPILNAALLAGIGRDASWACGHNEWAPTRKIDIRDWPMSAMRAQVAAVLSGAPTPVTDEDDDMLPEDRKLLQELHWMITQDRGQIARLPGIQSNVDKLSWAVFDDAQGLRTQVARLEAEVQALRDSAS